jgi:hypothetical protein
MPWWQGLQLSPIYKEVLVGWWHLLFRDFGPYGMIFMSLSDVITVAMVMLLRDLRPYGTMFMNVRVVITVAITMMLKDFGPYGMIFMTTCVHYFRLSRHFWRAIYLWVFIFFFVVPKTVTLRDYEKFQDVVFASSGLVVSALSIVLQRPLCPYTTRHLFVKTRFVIQLLPALSQLQNEAYFNPRPRPLKITRIDFATLHTSLINQNYTHEEIKNRLNEGKAR